MYIVIGAVQYALTHTYCIYIHNVYIHIHTVYTYILFAYTYILYIVITNSKYNTQYFSVAYIFENCASNVNKYVTHNQLLSYCFVHKSVTDMIMLS